MPTQEKVHPEYREEFAPFVRQIFFLLFYFFSDPLPGTDNPIVTTIDQAWKKNHIPLAQSLMKAEEIDYLSSVKKTF